MTQTTRLFRIFVSSTFADLTAERNILQQTTFPALREYCRKKGVEFQAIDLRWGVSEEASLDQQTMNICLGEIRRCQALTPRPNFLVLLGQRYGWVPPPPQIPAKDFEEMSHFWSQADRQLVETWYRRDDNAVPPAYVLLPRTGTEDWQTIEQQLVSALGQGARSAGWQGSRLLPYCASATHQEIAAGALEVDTPAEKVLCIFRDLEIPAASKNEASVYCDLNTTAIEALRHDLTQALLDENILRVQAAWDVASQAPATAHLQAMADEVYERLRSQIDLELEAPASIVSDEASRGLPASKFLDDEGQQHLAFARNHLEHFVGRSEALAAVEQHLQQHDGRMLVVQGAGGSGKTAFLSRVLQGIHASHPDAHIIVWLC